MNESIDNGVSVLFRLSVIGYESTICAECSED